MRSVMTHQFSRVPSATIPRSTFDRSHGHKTTFDAGYLIPIFADEALPGDTFQCKMSAFARMATPIFPIMDNMVMDVHFFSVPIRLLWDNWQKFNGERKNPTDSIDFLIPQCVAGAGGFPQGGIYDYFGIPPLAPNLSISALHLRAYNLIWNEWYRDENLQSSVVENTDDGPDNIADYTLLRRGKRHDYFTSCLPWPQKGPGVQIPLGEWAPVVGDINDPVPNFVPSGNAAASALMSTQAGATPPSNVQLNTPQTNAGILSWGHTGLVTDLSQATAATINSLRQAFQIQKIYERDARGGTRYTELVRSHFGVTSPDARLQRPEYLGGGTVPVNISPIPQTSSTDAATSPQGNMAGYGTIQMSIPAFTASFTEHCVIVGLVSVRADLTYQQGLNRMWSRRTRFDFYLPALSHIGEQAVLRREIFCNGVPTEDETVFGYQERFAEYRYKPSLITGLFRSAYAENLDAWHLSQLFVNAPVLGPEFIQEDPPLDRVIAVPTEPHFLFDSYFSLRCTRPMPVYGVPGLIDHF